jgi:antitoxin VapB
MSLNIKNPETHRMAKELAQRRAVSVTQAVTDALREALDQEPMSQRRFEKALDITKEIRAALAPEALAFKVDDLYDEQGLPR